MKLITVHCDDTHFSAAYEPGAGCLILIFPDHPTTFLFRTDDDGTFLPTYADALDAIRRRFPEPYYTVRTGTERRPD